MCKYMEFNPKTFLSTLSCELAFASVFHVGHSCENKFAFKLGSHAGLLQVDVFGWF